MKPQSKRIPRTEWNKYEEEIKRLYAIENKSQAEVLAIMRDEHNFRPSKSQLETKFKDWGVRKYSSKDEWQALGNVLQQRGSKESNVYVNGKRVSPDRIRKELRRHKIPTTNLISAQAQFLPRNIIIHSPPCDNASPVPLEISRAPPDVTSRDFGMATPLQIDPIGEESTHMNSLIDRNCSSLSSGDLSAIHYPLPHMNGGLSDPMMIPDIFFPNMLEDYQLWSLRNVHLSSDLGLVHSVPNSTSVITHSIATVSKLLDPVLDVIQQLQPMIDAYMQSSYSSIHALALRIKHRYCPYRSQLVQMQSVTTQAVYFILSAFCNNHINFFRLANPTTDDEFIFKTILQHVFPIVPRFLAVSLDRLPVPYQKALTNGLLNAAVLIGNVEVAKAIFHTGCDLGRVFCAEPFSDSPFVNACQSGNLEMVKTFLEYIDSSNGDTVKVIELFFSYFSFDKVVNELAKGKEHLEVIRLLLSKGLEIHPYDLEILLRYSDHQLLTLLSCHFQNHDYTTFPRSCVILGILGNRNLDGEILSNIVKGIRPSFLERNLEDIDMQRALTAALSTAAYYKRLDVIPLLHSFGAQANSNSLINAVLSGDMAIVVHFLNLGLDPNAKPIEDDLSIRQEKHIRLSTAREVGSAMCISIEKGFKAAFEEFERRGFVKKLELESLSFQSTLLSACKAANETLVQYLLSLRKQSWICNLSTAIHTAIDLGREDLVRQLLCAGISPDKETLSYAVEKQQSNIWDLLVEFCSFDEYEKISNIWFHMIQCGNISFMKKLLPFGCPVAAVMYFSHRTAGLGDWEELKMLKVASKELSWRITLLSAAIIKGDGWILNLIQSYGPRLNQTDYERPNTVIITALAACVIKNDLCLLEEFLSKGADPFDNGAIFIAALLDRREIAKVLIDKFARQYPSGTKSFGSSALLYAIESRNIQMVNLLAGKADLYGETSKDDYSFDENAPDGRSPLAGAIRIASRQGGQSEVLSVLLNHVENLDMPVKQCKHGKLTALLYAIELKSYETVELLVNAGANSSLPARYRIKRTPLQAAAEVGDEKIIRYLLQQGADINEAPAANAGATALQLAAIKGHIGIAIILMEQGAKVNAEPAMINGRTAFEGAAEHGRLDMMRLLAQNGADLLGNNREQYERAVHFAEQYRQSAAKLLADELLEQAVIGESSRAFTAGQFEGPIDDITAFLNSP